MNLNLEKILADTDFSYSKAENQSDRFSNNHTVFDCTIKYGNKSYTFTYQCNLKYQSPNLEDVLQCLADDAMCYEDSCDDFFNFCDDLGYEYNRESKKIFDACKKTYDNLIDIYGNIPVFDC